METNQQIQFDQQSLHEIQCQFQEEIQKVYQFQQQDISWRLTDILNSDQISLENIKSKFYEIQDMIQQNKIIFLCIDYRKKYQEKKIQLDNILTLGQCQYTFSSLPSLMQNKQEKQENSYQSIQKEGTDKIREMFSQNSEHLPPFIEYLISHVDNIDLNDQKFKQILENLDMTIKQMNQILNTWEHYRLKLKEIKQKEKSDLTTSSQMKNSEQNLFQNSQNTIQNINLSKSQFNSTQNQLKLTNYDYLNTTITKTEFQYKDITLNNNPFRFEIPQQIINKRDKDLSQIYTLVYQQQDRCLDQVSLKVICDFQQILNLINNLKQDQVKTIAFYGDFKLSMKIISQYYSKNPEWMKLISQNTPDYDKLVALTDGQLVFLILQEQEESFEGDIYENEEGLLFIRFLLDCCPIFITCLNQKQVSNWSDKNPFQQFEAIVLPNEFKKKSQMYLKKVILSSNQQQKGKTLLSSDQNNCIIMNEYQFSLITDNNNFQNQSKQIELNKTYINDLFKGNELYQSIDFEKILLKKHIIKNIFNRYTNLQQEIDQIYQKFQKNLVQLQNNHSQKNVIKDLFDQPKNKLLQLEKKFQYIHNNVVINDAERQQKNEVISTENLNKENKFSLQIINNNLQDSICKNCQIVIGTTIIKNYGCRNCLVYQIMVDEIHKKIDEKRRQSNSKNIFINQNLQEKDIIQLIKGESNNKRPLNFNYFSKYLLYQKFWTHFKIAQNEVLSYLSSLSLSSNIQFQKNIVNTILDFIFCATYEAIKEIVIMREQTNQQIINEKNNFLMQIENCFSKMKSIREKRIFIYLQQLTYDPLKKEQVLLSINFKNQYFILNEHAHKLVDYISFDDQVDYIVVNNCNEPNKAKHKTFIYKLRKKKQNSDLEYAFAVADCLDLCLYINQYSRQWVIFNNDTKKNSFGKIGSDYRFEEGRIDINVYEQQTSNGNIIRRVDSCIILNEKNNTIILYEKQKKQFYELFLSGQLKEIKFDLNREVFIDGNFKLQNILVEQSGYIQSVKNSSEGDFYIFQTDKFLFLTNPNYTVKHEIALKQNFSSYKLIVTDASVLLVILYENNQQECYIIKGMEEEQDDDNIRCITNQSDEKDKIGNILIDKMIKSMVHYGGNYEQIGCPGLVEQLIYYETNLQENIQDFEKRIEKYFKDCLESKGIQFKITCNRLNCFNNINLLLSKIDSLTHIINSISRQDLQFILQTRVPIQITMIQQANYLPLKDGLFQQDLMNVPLDEDQIEQIKKKISFGWIENLIQSQNKEIYVVSIGGKQSVGKSAQLNRLFGTRFGVLVSRCTDGIWIGLSKIQDKLILVLDCEGLFSIRRSEDEEIKLLLQITSISDITMIFCDIEGFNQPLISLFKKLQICSGKMQSDSFFQGTMVLLTKNIQDEGDRKKLLQESQSHLNKKEIKNVISNIFKKGGISYGFLSSYNSKDYDSNLQKVRDELLYNGILFKKKAKNPTFLMNILKYSMIQIYLNDDQDIDLISKQAEIKEIYNNFVDFFFDVSKQTFINEEKIIIQFEYIPTQFSENQLIQYKSAFRYDSLHKQILKCQENQQKQLIKPTNLDLLNSNYFSDERKYENQDISQIFLNSNFEDQGLNVGEGKKSHNILVLNQCNITFSPNQPPHKKSQNFERLEFIFDQCFNILKRANFNNYVLQMHNFFNIFIEQRKNIIKEYFQNQIPKDLKYESIVHSFEQELNAQIHNLEKQFIICQQKCNKCNRICVNVQGHQGDCDCETSHKCYLKCEICNNNNECFLISGHKEKHYCKEMNHLCQQSCQVSKSCIQLCTLNPHQDDVLHNCQGQHKCEQICRLYDKCGKTCSLESGHIGDNHLCDSNYCYEKCQLCNKLCGIKLHDHDILLSNIEKNKHLLMKNGKLVTQHLCGNSHNCLNQCQFPGVCSITYQSEEKIWETKNSKFDYQFIKPSKKIKNCNIKIKPWDTHHDGMHECANSKFHRCDQQCPECLSYCLEKYNHSGNHKSKNHRNKENCVFISQSNEIKINSLEGNIRCYQPGDFSTPENCLSSCLRMGRAHTHLRVCQGGDLCAEKKYPFARHSKKQYKPFTHLAYDEMLCKGYWNSINWEPPADEDNLQIIQKCNIGCSHESHQDKPNYCIKQAWHEGHHALDQQYCEHLGSSLVDICFTIDTTSSMDWAMQQVGKTINDIVNKFEGKANIKYSVVSYRDHPPEDYSYVYNIDSQLTDRDNILQVLNQMNADGGGDVPEAVMDGLYHSVASIKWRDNSHRFIFHICDSPPHGQQFGYSSNNPSWTKNGCPCGINEKLIAQLIRKQQILYYLVQVNPFLNKMANIFQSLFGSFFKQQIYLEDTNKLNIEILYALGKEINTTNEFYHVNENNQQTNNMQVYNIQYPAPW